MNISKLQEVLKLKRVTQKELAELLNMTQASVSAMLKKGDMKCSQLEVICNYIDVSPALFLETKNSNQPSDNVNIQSIVGSNNRQINIQRVEIEKLQHEIDHLHEIIKQKNMLIENQQDLIEILKGNISLSNTNTKNQ